MKTFARLIRRYVLATVAVMALLLALLVALMCVLGGIAQRSGNASSYYSQKVADALADTGSGLEFDAQKSPAQWMQGYEWAMVLNDSGEVIWQYDLPAELYHTYTSSEIAGFARWYLGGYPVFCWVEDYGLFVIALTPGSLWRSNTFCNVNVVRAGIRILEVSTIAVPLLVAALCLGLSWRGAQSLRDISSGLETLAEGGAVQLPVKGFTAEVAQKLNKTSAQLQRRNEIIAQRDMARTNWIAGVSHDIRTPLALILGWSEQLEHDMSLPPAARQKAGNICTQSEKIRSLIEDLNLTSKLQYGEQPLRKTKTQAGPLLRQIVAAFYDTPPAGNCTAALELTDEVERAVLNADTQLLTRAVENLLNNSVNHNTAPVHITLTAECGEKTLRLTVADDGAGYPPAVLRALRGSGQATVKEGGAPHILGLHVVEQIVQAHGGVTVFAQCAPHGAKTIITLPTV